MCVIFYERRTRTVNAQTGGDGIKPVIGLKLLHAADDGREVNVANRCCS